MCFNVNQMSQVEHIHVEGTSCDNSGQRVELKSILRVWARYVRDGAV